MNTTFTPQPQAPYSCVYSPNFAELLTQFGGSIAISTFQAGKMCFISPKSDHELTNLLRTVPNSMGFDYVDGTLAVASGLGLGVYKNYPGLAVDYPDYPGVYDAVFLEKALYQTGKIDAHDVMIADDAIYMVYTHGNSIFKLTDGELTHFWSPPFIENNNLEDRCHLNGICRVEGKLTYASMLSLSNENQGWRKQIPKGGCIMHIESNTIIAQDLHMPHSPRYYNGQLLVLESAKERLISIDPQDGKVTEICQLDGFLRGMHIVGDYAIIGTSRLRKNSSIFNHLPIAEKNLRAGVYIVHLPTGMCVGNLKFQNTIDELFEVKILPHKRPNLLPMLHPKHQLATVFNNKAYWLSNHTKVEQ